MPESSSQRASPRESVCLEQVLEALSPAELASLAQRLGVELDGHKRISRARQVARALSARGSPARPPRHTDAERELLIRLAAQGGVERVERLPSDAQRLIEQGWLFVRERTGAVELTLPIALLLTLPVWPGEDASSARVLLAQLPPHEAAEVGRCFAGKPVVSPWSLALEPAYLGLVDPAEVARLVAQLTQPARDLLHAVVELGGEVNTEELLDLEQQPMRLHHGPGVARVRRGVGYELERHALLLPVAPNRHVVPREVMQVVSAAHYRAARVLRSRLRTRLLVTPREPLRARYAIAPSARALALTALATTAVLPRPHVGTPRRSIARWAERLGMASSDVQLLACLCRKLGLWERAAGLRREIRVRDLGLALFGAWQSGGVWDEGREEPEVWRAPKAPAPSPALRVRAAVLEALSELAESAWIPWEILRGFVLAHPDLVTITRQYQRFQEQSRLALITPEATLEQVVFHSLATLGMLDVGELDEVTHSGPQTRAVRLSALGRRALRELPRGARGPQAVTPPAGSSADDAPSAEAARTNRYVSAGVLRIGPESESTLGEVLDVLRWCELGEVGGHIDLVLSSESFERRLGAGYESSAVREELERLAPLSDGVLARLEAAAHVEARLDFVPASGFLWIDDDALLERVRAERSLGRCFIEPSPPGGLLISPNVNLERLALKCRALGLELRVDGARYVLAASNDGPRARG